MMKFQFPLAAMLFALGAFSNIHAEDTKKSMEKLIEFKDQAAEPKWIAVNDGVMGGLSKGGPEVKDGSLHFTGDLSLENNGGFSSIRSVNQKYDFSGKTSIVIRLKGDGRKYQLRLATDARYRRSAVSYGSEFSTEKGKWIEVKIPFESLSPSWRGMKLKDPDFDPAKVEELGLLIADKKEGEFELEVDWIAVE
jgi:NADH dehydrogenase [ubiquinone] 1 alpha subcomplex assembly factor 1